MTNYITIKGANITSVSSDPANPVEGQVWYNTTSTVLKGYKAVIGTGTWASGGGLNTSRYGPGGTGTQTAALCFFGEPPLTTAAESYNGSTWSNITSANTARYVVASIGQVQTDAAGVGGYGDPVLSTRTEIWNGSSWTESGQLGTARAGWTGGAGTTTAGLVTNAGGGSPSTAPTLTDIFDGSTWSEGGALNQGRQYGSTTGATSTAALTMGGYGVPPSNPTRRAYVEEYNGSSWAVQTEINTARIEGGACGTSTACILAGGSIPPGTNITESWNGTAWTEVADMGNNKNAMGRTASTGDLAAMFGGHGSTGTTEEWTVPATTYAIKTFTAS
jgi:hypothetical protein